MEEKRIKISVMTLVHNNGDYSDRGTDTKRRVNLTIRPSGGSAYLRMPKELGTGNIILKRAILEFDPPIDLETLESEEYKKLCKAKNMVKVDYGEKPKPTHIQHESIKAVLLMRLLGLPDRDEPEDIFLYRKLKEKLQDIGARWFKADVEMCKKLNKEFKVEDSVEAFLKNSHAKSKMIDAGLTDEQIGDNEMIEAVMRKIIDEQLETADQKYGKVQQDQVLEEWRALHKEASKPEGRAKVKKESSLEEVQENQQIEEAMRKMGLSK